MSKKFRKNFDRRPDHIWESAYLNNVTFLDYFDRMKMVAMSRLKYDGLPDTIDERFFRLGLFERGQMLMFLDETLGVLALPFNQISDRNIYDIPVKREAYAPNGKYRKRCDDTNSVIIYNNANRAPDMPTTTLFATRIADIQRTIDVNVKGQKTPKIVTGTQQQRLAMENLLMQWEGNELFIMGDKSITGAVEMGVLDTTAPYVADKLEIQKHQMINEYLSYLGIDNSNQDKKERMVASEVGANNGLVAIARKTAINTQQECFDRANELWGLNIKVDYDNDYVGELLGSPVAKNPRFSDEGEDSDNG